MRFTKTPGKLIAIVVVTGGPVASDAFRRELQQEAQRWRSAGLISEEQFQQLSQQYEFVTLETAARDRFVMILLGLGSILVGIGAMTFVAANWQALPQTWKAGLLVMAMVICNFSGFTLINRIAPNDRWRRLGQALLLLGALLLGANLALMGQIVHTSSTRYELCAAWAIGVLAMAYGVRLTFLGLLALLILGIGYWSALWDLLWLQSSVFGVWTLQMMPLLAAIAFLPLCYRCPSPLLFALSAMAVTSSLMVLVFDVGRSLPALFDALLLIMPFALLWAYDDTLWQQLRLLMGRRSPSPVSRPDQDHEAAETSLSFQPVARGLMLFSLSLLYWLLSFQDVWFTSASRSLLNPPLVWRNTSFVVLTLLVSTRLIARIIYIPNRLLGAFILILSFVGVFSIRNSFTDAMFAAGFGFLGYILRRLDWPLVPIVLGLVLGSIMIEKLTAGAGQIKTVFDLVNRPVSGTLFVVILIVIGVTIVSSLRTKRFEH